MRKYKTIYDIKENYTAEEWAHRSRKAAQLYTSFINSRNRD